MGKSQFWPQCIRDDVITLFGHEDDRRHGLRLFFRGLDFTSLSVPTEQTEVFFSTKFHEERRERLTR